MTKKLEEVFNLGPILDIEPELEVTDLVELNSEIDDMKHLIIEADKIDAALPMVSSIEALDADFDDYAKKSLVVFDDLIELSKNVEDHNLSPLVDSASKMMQNALTAKTTKANKKLEMIKLQIQKAKLEHEKEKLAFAKLRYTPDSVDLTDENNEGGIKITARRTDMIIDIIENLKNNKD